MHTIVSVALVPDFPQNHKMTYKGILLFPESVSQPVIDEIHQTLILQRPEINIVCERQLGIEHPVVSELIKIQKSHANNDGDVNEPLVATIDEITRIVRSIYESKK